MLRAQGLDCTLQDTAGEHSTTPADGQTSERDSGGGVEPSGAGVLIQYGLPKIRGPLFGSPFCKSPAVLVAIFGPLIVGNSHIYLGPTLPNTQRSGS